MVVTILTVEDGPFRLFSWLREHRGYLSRLDALKALGCDLLLIAS